MILLVLKYEIVLCATYFVTFDRIMIKFQFYLEIIFEIIFFEILHKIAYNPFKFNDGGYITCHIR